MTELKTRPTGASVQDFLNGIEDEQRRRDCFTVLELMRRATGAEPQMWGDSIVGFGSYHYRYASGQEADWPLTGFSPRKQNLTLYMMSGFHEYDDLLAQLGKHKTGKACLYIKRLEDIDLPALQRLIEESVKQVEEAHR